MPEGLIGQSLRRLEDARFLTGHGRYVADADAAGHLHLHVLRSPHAHALIRGIETAAALALPGVRAVLTGADVLADGIGPLPCPAVVATEDPLIVPPRHVLAVERVRHVGEPVACVVAESAAIARDAAELIAVEYEALPALVDAATALAPGAPQLWPQAPGNRAFLFRKGDPAAVAMAFAQAAHVVELPIYNNRVHAAPIEPRAAIGSHDAATGTLLLEATTQVVHGIRRQLAEAVFRLPEARVQVAAPDVGGGFGLKNFLFPEYVLVLWAARRLGRSVRWVGDGSEEFPGAVHARDMRADCRMALDAAGRILALDVRMVADMGAYCSPNGPGCPTNSFSTALGSLYAIPAIALEVRGAFTNTTPVDAYRGAGKPEANYITERMIEAAARQIGLAPEELRRRNFIRRFPHRGALGMVLDTGDFAGNLDRALALADRPGFAARRAASEARGFLRGFGLACFMETARGAPNEGAAIRFEADGMVTLTLGTQSNGQGHETSFPQIAAELLGLPIEQFRFVQADTRLVANGHGHGGARSMHQGGTALVKAAEAVLAKARRIAAQLLQATPQSLDFAAGRFCLRGTAHGIGLPEIATAARDPANLPPGESPGLDEDVWNLLDVFTFPSGCHVAEVEIDRETGQVRLDRYLAVDDYGRVINPMLTIGQVQGGLAQGIGQALLEEVVYDHASGQLLAGSLMDYCLPRAADLPMLPVELRPVPTRANPLGVKGAGQAGCIGAPQTVMHAVLDALAPFGVRHLDMPATAERVWRAMRPR